MRINLLLGRFSYGKRGILDLTHCRLYTFSSLKNLFEQCGFNVTVGKGIPAPFPKAIGENWLGHLLVFINNFLIKISKGLFSYQIYMEATPTPVVSELLSLTKQESLKRAEEMKTNQELISSNVAQESEVGV